MIDTSAPEGPTRLRREVGRAECGRKAIPHSGGHRGEALAKGTGAQLQAKVIEVPASERWVEVIGLPMLSG
jgi:hypothetical protein